jgi:hypothetical protein
MDPIAQGHSALPLNHILSGVLANGLGIEVMLDARDQG